MLPLFVLEFRAAPQTEHPQFWNLDSALVTVVLYARDPDEAEANGRQILAISLWDEATLLRAGVLPETASLAVPSGTDVLSDLAQMARSVGFALSISGVAAAGDDAPQA